MPAKQNYRLENLLLDDSFVRFIKDIAGEEEKVYWQEWQHQHPDHQVLVREAKELIEFSEYDQGRIPDSLIELKKFEESLKGSSFFLKKPGRMKMRRSRKSSGSYWPAAAVIVFIVLSVAVLQFIGKGSGTAFQEDDSTVSNFEYRTGFGEKAFLNLSDGSRIVLNANSHLTYSWSGSGNSGQNIIDIHMEGEAWFDIEPLTGDGSRLLRVHTHDGVVEVTGTIFAVQTSSKGTRTVLEEGKVRVARQPSRAVSGSEQTGSHSTILQPGEMAQLIPGNDEILLEKVNPRLYTSWIRDVWTFDQTPLNQIAERIETVFGIKVNISSADLQNETLSGTISSANLQLIKEGLSEALQVQVRQVNDTIIIGPVKE